MVAKDTYHPDYERNMEPAYNVALISPDNDNDLSVATRAISFATAGALKIDTLGGQTVTIPNGALSAGVLHPIRVTRVYETGTDAANIVGYW